VVRTDRVTPARDPRPVRGRAKVVEAWQAEERRKLADAKVKEALDKANAAATSARSPRSSGWSCARPSR
jgi:peptidyl-prolyl cis-trans isomerase D